MTLIEPADLLTAVRPTEAKGHLMSYLKYNSDGRILVAHLAPGLTPEQAAQAMGLAAGSWQVITAEEAAELQKPTAQEIAGQRGRQS